ncbi:mitochondrial carrier domain-containing protein [Halteromyces radiatus]|uniref:mitochondrial carrier domain-containing protein n=1 Tax=Halteromyces radiatus TaxID=101107 RepID=UPI002220DCEE|nr:mitochondrial carrier domain-containing protein [Halteromyces radiatus]KAI8099745.1 mitochondrial carrier domain-containing protein [Halteromyces radiatus]
MSSTADNGKDLPFSLQLTCGAIAGVVEILALYPLDVVKTRAQLNSGVSVGVLSSFKDIIGNEGIPTLYRGIAFPLSIEAPKRAITFAANEQFTVFYKRLFGLDHVTPPLAMATGVSAGITEAAVIVPFELVKVRLQDKANASKYKNALDALKKIIQHEGVLALYNGLEATILRHAIWNGGYFSVISTVRGALPEATNKNEQLRNNFVAGTVGGIFGTILNAPTDVVKSRIQGYTGVGPKKYNWTFPSIILIGREEGIRSLYRGFVPKVLRLGPGGGILLVVYDTVSNWMKRHVV